MSDHEKLVAAVVEATKRRDAVAATLAEVERKAMHANHDLRNAWAALQRYQDELVDYALGKNLE